jgi:hypothetical protein
MTQTADQNELQSQFEHEDHQLLERIVWTEPFTLLAMAPKQLHLATTGPTTDVCAYEARREPELKGWFQFARIGNGVVRLYSLQYGRCCAGIAAGWHLKPLTGQDDPIWSHFRVQDIRPGTRETDYHRWVCTIRSVHPIAQAHPYLHVNEGGGEFIAIQGKGAEAQCHFFRNHSIPAAMETAIAKSRGEVQGIKD